MPPGSRRRPNPSRWSFANRQAPLEEMLEAWERAVIDDVIALIGSRAGDARKKPRRPFASTRPTPDAVAVMTTR